MNVMNFASTPVTTIAPHDSIDRAIALMEEESIHHLVVVSEGRAVGMVSDRDILISTGWMFMVERRSPRGVGAHPRVVGPTRIEQIMSRPVIGIKERGSAQDAARLMLNRGIGALPMLRNQKVVGIVSEWDLLRWFDELALNANPADRLLACEVNELMTTMVISVAPAAPLDDVVSLFRQRRIHHMPVAVDSELHGIISDRDVRRALGWAFICDMQAESTLLAEACEPATAKDVMQANVKTISLNNTLREALHEMLENRIHSLPVVFKNRLLGILTTTDFVKAIAQKDVLCMEGLICE